MDPKLPQNLDALCAALPFRSDGDDLLLEELIDRAAAAAPAFEGGGAVHPELIESRGLALGWGAPAGPGAPNAYQEHAINELGKWVELEGKTVLEIGTDVTGTVVSALSARGIRFALGIDVVWPENRARVLSPKVVLAHGDIVDLPYASDSFDIALNIATFEHIVELEEALLAMYRLLKPGGLVFALFGPLWSSAVGHHIWCDVGGHAFRFTEPGANPIGDFEHLLYDRAGLAARLSAAWEPEVVQRIVEFVYDSPMLNRKFHHEIEDIVASTDFEVLCMENTWTLEAPPEILSRLRERHGDRTDFSCAAMQIVLRKPVVA